MARRSAQTERNLFDLYKAIDAVGEKFEGVILSHYRAAVWAVFEQLVLTTPQFSGRAAANWNIGINAPDMTFDPNLGESMGPEKAKDGHTYTASFTPREAGDRGWAEVAFHNNKYKLMHIKSNTRVFISNATRGDVDEKNGRTSEYYLSDLQDAGYWQKRLRIANQPYETVSQVLLTESWRGRLGLKGDSVNQRFFQ